MIRTINIILLFTSLLALTAVYLIKFSVEETAGTRRSLQSQIEKQEADLSMIKADWAYLTQPTHIDPIVKRHADVLKLAVLDQKMIKGEEALAALPMRPIIVPDNDALNDLFNSLDLGIDPVDGLNMPLTSDPQPSAVDMGQAIQTNASVDVVVPAPAPRSRVSAPMAAPAPAPQPVLDPLAALIEQVD